MFSDDDSDDLDPMYEQSYKDPYQKIAISKKPKQVCCGNEKVCGNILPRFTIIHYRIGFHVILKNIFAG